MHERLLRQLTVGERVGGALHGAYVSSRGRLKHPRAARALERATRAARPRSGCQQYAHAFFNHTSDGAITSSERFTSGPSLDGKGTFSFADAAPSLGQASLLQPAPPEVHAGAEATGDVATSAFGRLAQTAKEAVGVED